METDDEKKAFINSILQPIKLSIKFDDYVKYWYLIVNDGTEDKGFCVDFCCKKKYHHNGFRSLAECINYICVWITEFIVHQDASIVAVISNPYLGSRSLEEMMIRKDLIGNG